MNKHRKKAKFVTKGAMGVPQFIDNPKLKIDPTDPTPRDYRGYVFVSSRLLEGHTPKHKAFLRKAIQINRKDDYFTHDNFPELSPENFRKIVNRLMKKGAVIQAFRGSHTEYQVIGVPMRNPKRVVVVNTTLGESFLDQLDSLEVAPSGIHDLRFEFKSTQLHQSLKRCQKPHPQNSGIFTGMPISKDLVAKIHIYPFTITIDISCTYRPFACDLGGLSELLMAMGQIYGRLLQWVGSTPDFPIPDEWIVTSFHFGRDGRSYSGPSVNITFSEFAAGWMRFYIKKWPDGKQRPRIELGCTPKLSLKMIFQRGFEAEDKALNGTLQCLRKEAKKQMLKERNFISLE